MREALPCNPYFAMVVPSALMNGMIRRTASTVVTDGPAWLGVRAEPFGSRAEKREAA